MQKEFIKETRHSVTLNVTAGRIDSFRETEKTTGTARVYENGCVGIAGCLGEPDEDELTKKASGALSFGIPYPCDLEGALEMEVVNEEEIIKIPDFIPTMQAFLDRLGDACPRFALSNKISLGHTRKEYRNSNGRRLISSNRSLSIQLLAQNRGSGNLFDTGFGWDGNFFDADMLFKQFKKEYDAFYTPADLTPGRYPIVTPAMNLFATFLRHFIGDLCASGASLLSGKLGQKVFSDKLTVRDDMNRETNPGVCFFDAEGCVAEDFRPTLIENGVLTGLLTTKKSAAAYGLKNLGTADAAYDGVPSFGLHGLYLDATAKTLKELVPGKAIYVLLASGGDATPDGHFATPVQMAYLLENGEIVGRLPDLNIGGGFFDLLGRDYVGTVDDAFFKGGGSLTAVMMDVDKA